MKRANYDQYCNWRRAVRLNNPRTFAELRSLYRSIMSGTQYGCYSGYSP